MGIIGSKLKGKIFYFNQYQYVYTLISNEIKDNGTIKRQVPMIHDIITFMCSDIAIIIYEVAVVIILLVILIKTIRKRNAKKDMRRVIHEKLRDDELKISLENIYADENLKSEAAKSVPYKVSYHDEKTSSNENLSIQITEKTDLSTREYIFNIESLIGIGNGLKNDIVLSDPLAVTDDAQIIRQGKFIYLKKVMPVSTMYLIRKKKNYQVGEIPVQLLSKDEIVIGNTSLEIVLL